jgi:type II secretory pathway pseudopilin PulG
MSPQRTRRLARQTPRTARDGMTLVEVVIAMGLIAGVLLSLSGFAFRLAKGTTSARVVATATQLAQDRLDNVKNATKYSTIDSLFPGTESPVSNYPGFTRKTIVQHVGGTVTDSLDYRVITVEVSHVRLTSPIRKTTVIAAF